MVLRYAIAGFAMLLGLPATACTQTASGRNGLDANSDASPDSKSDAPGGDAACEVPTAAEQRESLRAWLLDLMDSPRFVFGQQRFNVIGVNWVSDGDLERSDVKTITGSHPGVIGFDVWDIAIKPRAWTPTTPLQALAAKTVAAHGGIVTFDWHVRGCGDVESFRPRFNEDCLCRIANDEVFAEEWFKKGKLDLFADALHEFGLDELPLVFRPWHEMNGDWFWWGEPFWDCRGRLPGSTVTGPDAFKKVFQMTLDYLRDDRGLDNLLVAYAPNVSGDGHADEARYLEGYPGDEYVDILGLDAYVVRDKDLWQQSENLRSELAMVSRIARDRSKVAALTEVGNWQLVDERAGNETNWFSSHLLKVLTDPDVDIAYVLTWENRRADYQEFYVPFRGHAAQPDFVRFFEDDATLFLDDLDPLGPGDLTECSSCGGPETRAAWGCEGGELCRTDATCRTPPLCSTCDADPDGDGVGTQDGGEYCLIDRECIVCSDCAKDPDGDGWGWENNASCRVPLSCLALCSSCDADPDDDGWGWEPDHLCAARPDC